MGRQIFVREVLSFLLNEILTYRIENRNQDSVVELVIVADTMPDTVVIPAEDMREGVHIMETLLVVKSTLEMCVLLWASFDCSSPIRPAGKISRTSSVAQVS